MADAISRFIGCLRILIVSSAVQALLTVVITFVSSLSGSDLGFDVMAAIRGIRVSTFAVRFTHRHAPSRACAR